MPASGGPIESRSVHARGWSGGRGARMGYRDCSSVRERRGVLGHAALYADRAGRKRTVRVHQSCWQRRPLPRLPAALDRSGSQEEDLDPPAEEGAVCSRRSRGGRQDQDRVGGEAVRLRGSVPGDRGAGLRRHPAGRDVGGGRVPSASRRTCLFLTRRGQQQFSGTVRRSSSSLCGSRLHNLYRVVFIIDSNRCFWITQNNNITTDSSTTFTTYNSTTYNFYNTTLTHAYFSCIPKISPPPSARAEQEKELPMKSLILCVLSILVLAACEGSGPTAADPGARSGDSSLGKAAPSIETCPPCQKQECPAQPVTRAEFTDARGAFISVALSGATQVQADQLRLAFGMPTREDVEKAARTYMPREQFDPMVYSCKRVGVANVWPYLDATGSVRYGTVVYDTLYVPILEEKDGMVKSVAQDDDGRLVVVYFRADDLVSNPDRAVDSGAYYRFMERVEALDDFVLVPGACTKEFMSDHLASVKKKADDAYPVIAE